MGRLLLIVLLLLCVLDVFTRVIPSQSGGKTVKVEPVDFPELHLTAPHKPIFNKHLFGEIEEEQVIAEKKTEKAKPKRQQIDLLAILTAPQPKAYVSLKGKANSATMLEIGQVFNGYKLTKINKYSAFFSVEEKQIELTVFKVDK